MLFSTINSFPSHPTTAMPSSLAPQASKGAEGRLWGSWPCTGGCLLAQNGALLQPSSQLGQTAPVGAQKLRETGEPMRGAAAPVQRFDCPEWQLDELRHGELALWRINYAASREKSQLWVVLCVFTQCQRDGCHDGEDAFQRVIYSPEILRGCLLDHAGEWKLLKSRMLEVQVGAGSRFISLGCWELVKCHNYYLFSSHPWLLHGSDLWNSNYLCHGNNTCWHSHPSPLFDSPSSHWALQKQREWEEKWSASQGVFLGSAPRWGRVRVSV